MVGKCSLSVQLIHMSGGSSSWSLGQAYTCSGTYGTHILHKITCTGVIPWYQWKLIYCRLIEKCILVWSYIDLTLSGYHVLRKYIYISYTNQSHAVKFEKNIIIVIQTLEMILNSSTLMHVMYKYAPWLYRNTLPAHIRNGIYYKSLYVI
jgi:hypothetical protein